MLSVISLRTGNEEMMPAAFGASFSVLFPVITVFPGP